MAADRRTTCLTRLLYYSALIRRQFRWSYRRHKWCVVITSLQEGSVRVLVMEGGREPDVIGPLTLGGSTYSGWARVTVKSRLLRIINSTITLWKRWLTIVKKFYSIRRSILWAFISVVIVLSVFRINYIMDIFSCFIGFTHFFKFTIDTLTYCDLINSMF